MNTDVHSLACLRLICARASYLSFLFAKKLTVKGFSEPTRTSVVLISSDVFAAQKLASGSVHGCTLPDRLFSKKLTVKGSAERTRMSVVLLSSDVFAAQKLASGSVHGCTLPDRLFSKKLMVKGFSERTGMSVKLSSSEFAPQTRR